MRRLLLANTAGEAEDSSSLRLQRGKENVRGVIAIAQAQQYK